MELMSIIEDITERANANIQQEPNDYVKDGFLYCGKCHTPKQVRIEFMGKIFEPRCLCACATEKRDKEEAERKKQERAERIQRMRREGFPDIEMESCTFDKDDMSNARISRIAHKYVDNFQDMLIMKKGLLFYGTVGTGKTFISACIANALIDKGYPCMVTNFARLTNTLSGMFDDRQTYIDSLQRYKLLVIDDLGAERNTEYMNETVTQIIDARYRSGLPLIVTTNLTADALSYPSDTSKQRIYSRLLEMCVPVEVKGADRRKAKLKDDYGELKEMLGL